MSVRYGTKLVQRACACGCGKGVYAKRNDARYHSAACRQRAYRNRAASVSYHWPPDLSYQLSGLAHAAPDAFARLVAAVEQRRIDARQVREWLPILQAVHQARRPPDEQTNP